MQLGEYLEKKKKKKKKARHIAENWSVVNILSPWECEGVCHCFLIP